MKRKAGCRSMSPHLRSRGPRVGVIALVLAVVLGGPVDHAPAQDRDLLLEAQQASKRGDRLLNDGREREAVQLYLAAHQNYQRLILGYFERALRAELGGAPVDEDALMQADRRAADLRNVNLSKLWVVLDPEDRAHEQGLEAERAQLLKRFVEFSEPASSGPLEAFLNRLYPEDRSGDRQMEALRQGALPPSKRWERLDRPVQKE